MTTPVKPTFPFLASVGLSVSDLQICCIKEVEIIAITESEIVTVEYLGNEYDDIPIWMHTDYGTRRRVLQDAEASAPDYFERAALQFCLPGGLYFQEYPGLTVRTSENPTAIAIVRNTGTVETVLGIIGISQHGKQPLSGDNQYHVNNAKGWPSYLPCTMITETLTTVFGTTDRIVLWDMLNNKIANAPNALFTALLDADYATVITDYYHFLDQAIKLNGSDISYNVAYYGMVTFGAYCIGGSAVDYCITADGVNHGTDNWVFTEGDCHTYTDDIEATTCIPDSYYSFHRTPKVYPEIEPYEREHVLPAVIFPIWNGDEDPFIDRRYYASTHDNPNVVVTYSTGYVYAFSIGFTYFDNYDALNGYQKNTTVIFNSSVSGQKTISFEDLEILHIPYDGRTAIVIPENLMCSYDIYMEQIITWIEGATPSEPMKSTFLIDLQFHENSFIQESGFPAYVETMHEASLAGVDEADFVSLEYNFDLLFIPYWLKASTL